MQLLASVLLALGRAESRAQYIHFETVWDNLHSVHKYLKRSSDPLFIPWSRACRGTSRDSRPTPEEMGAEVVLMYRMRQAEFFIRCYRMGGGREGGREGGG